MKPAYRIGYTIPKAEDVKQAIDPKTDAPIFYVK